MNDTAISVNSISKCYQIYSRPQDRLRQAVLSRVDRVLFQQERRYFHEFWALHDVSFEVERGETVGIIGRNGSGKSTLLQIVCGTLQPTSGSVSASGRVAALLELGSGFNPEFTGRENVYLNAAILGLSHQQIDDRLDSIMRFADIGDFVDQPVKTYSSGMMLRLAFAVIAHVDADVLIIDEALAVGDAVFGQKCMRFLRRFRQKGTVLFVSHDAASVVALCNRAIWLDGGKVRMCGSAKDVADAYAKFCAESIVGDSYQVDALQDDSVTDATGRVDEGVKLDFFDNVVDSEGWTTGAAEIESVRMRRHDGSHPGAAFSGGEKVDLLVTARVAETLDSPIIGFLVKDRLGQALFGHNTYDADNLPATAPAGSRLDARFTFKLPLLPNGDYSITVAIANGDPDINVQHHWLHDAVLMSVASTKRRYGLVGIPFDHVGLEVGIMEG